MKLVLLTQKPQYEFGAAVFLICIEFKVKHTLFYVYVCLLRDVM